jgi:hypothetical protein
VDWLEAKGYQFREVDVLSNADAYARMRRISKQSLTPTLETADRRVLPDFDVAQLESFMLENDLLP